jgi:hypothetical protein
MRRRGYIHKAPWYARRLGRNVHPAERWVSLLGALGLMLLGRRRARNRPAAAAASTFLMRRGLTGVCPVYRRFGLSTT